VFLGTVKSKGDASQTNSRGHSISVAWIVDPEVHFCWSLWTLQNKHYGLVVSTLLVIDVERLVSEITYNVLIRM